MRVVFKPSQPLGSVAAPASKSELHRAIICAALGNSVSVISDVTLSDDVQATLDCVKILGCEVQIRENNIIITGNGGVITSGGVLNCRESASTLRFLLPVCMLSGELITLTGSKGLFARPIDVYEQICENQHIFFERGKDYVTVGGGLHGGEFTVKGNISSQFISGLMLALSLAREDSVINIVPPFESKPYVTMTQQMLQNYGIDTGISDNTVKIKGCGKYISRDTRISGDWSNGAVLLAMGINVTGLDQSSPQGDRVCTDIFKSLEKGFCRTDISDCPDLAPLLFAYAGMHYGGSFYGTNRLRLKESDRISCMECELERLGIVMRSENNCVTVEKSTVKAAKQPLFSHNDHRIAMALSYLLCFTGGVLENAESVNKSYPDFFEDIKSAGVKLDYEYDI